METIVISLQRTPERLREFDRFNADHLRYSVHPAVDGARLNPDWLVQNELADGSVRWKSGAVGCALSHLQLWQMAVSRNTAITICEDDALFHPEFEPVSAGLIASLPSDWDLVMWGWNFDAPLAADLIQDLSPAWIVFHQERMRQNAAPFLRAKTAPVPYKLRGACGTICYSISPTGAGKFLSNVLPIRKLDPAVTTEGIDTTMSHFYASFNCYVSIPPLVLTMNDKPASTVNAPALSTVPHEGFSKVHSGSQGQTQSSGGASMLANVASYLAGSGTKKLEIGAGSHIKPGWLSGDLYAQAAALGDTAIFLDATRDFPIPDESFDLIYTEHMIEHVGFDEGQRMLKECFRILRPGGVVRIVTPSLAFLMRVLSSDRSLFEEGYREWSVRTFVPGAPKVTNAFFLNNFVRAWGHTFIYDEETLHLALQSAGFGDIEVCELNASRHAELCGLEKEARLPEGYLALESMVMEGRKPQ